MCRGCCSEFRARTRAHLPALIFLRWLSEVERLLDHQVDPDAAFEAWTEGYSAAEYAREVEWEGLWR